MGIGCALYVGGASDTSPHLHHAIQICVSLDRPFRLRRGPDAPWRRRRGAVVGANQLHQLDGSGRELVIVYLEPESRDGRRIAVGDPAVPIQAIPSATVRAIRAVSAAARRGDAGPEAAAHLYREILTKLGMRWGAQEALDDRVRRALAAVREEPARRWRVAELARAGGLSPRRFRELFSAQIGMTCRQYLLWSHLRSALGEMALKAPLTRAALAGGFADAAHLARTFRRMLGIVPSAVAGSVSFLDSPGEGATAASFKTPAEPLL